MQKIFRKIDSKFFSGKLWQGFQKIQLVRFFLTGNSPRAQVTLSSNQVLLDHLSDKFGSDKGGTDPKDLFSWRPHLYTRVYSLIFSHFRLQVRNVLEVGIGTNNPLLKSSMGEKGKPGASLYMWREFFPNANIVGMDIEEEILFADVRIQTHSVDQTLKTSVVSAMSQYPDGHFDIIIDDGLHTFNANISLFENAVAKLSEQGVYIIEDIRLTDMSKFMQYFSATTFEYYFLSLHRPEQISTDNNMLVVKK